MCYSASYLPMGTIKNGHKHWLLFSTHSCSYLFLPLYPVVSLSTSLLELRRCWPFSLHQWWFTLSSRFMLLMDVKGEGSQLFLPHISVRNFLLFFSGPLSWVLSHTSLWEDEWVSVMWVWEKLPVGCAPLPGWLSVQEGIVLCSQPCGLSQSLQKEFQQFWVLD